MTADVHRALMFIQSLANKHRRELGWIPTAGIIHSIAKGNYALQIADGDPVGYMLTGPIRRQGQIRIYQACLQLDARRRGLATQMLQAWSRQIAATGATTIILGCRQDLEANEFWLQSGFTKTGERRGGETHGLRINIYQRPPTPAPPGGTSPPEKILLAGLAGKSPEYRGP